MLNKVQLSDIRTFVLISKLGNFTKAAEALNVSRSHVSRQLSQLEAQMGVTLLIRTTRTLKLTAAGSSFYHQCESALEQLDQAIISTVDDISDIRGDIKVNSVGGPLGEQIIAQIAFEFAQQHPDINIDLEFSSHRVDLISDDFDIAFRMGKLEDASFVARKLMDIKMGTWASRDYLDQHGHPAHPKELSQHNCLTGSVTKWSFQHIESNETIDIQIDGHLQCKNGHVLIRGAVNGNGIIRVPELYCEKEIQTDQLQPVFSEWGIPSVDFSAIYHKDRYQPLRLRAFIDFTKHWVDRFQNKLR
ncbi:LysR family transcriptional regulator [Vibrio marisflavi]|nr:LysR family transcriptional regulator [Vibrio marisflavi]